MVPSGFDKIINECHVMLILYFTLQTITLIPGHLLKIHDRFRNMQFHDQLCELEKKKFTKFNKG